ncbi:MAG: hypothetical protein KatS3mg102_0198 [Planctomycetota bacterium]|nr:MAG: hypothetical protein KatS3mg102_0198 [Planctomycetota bacterium]
MNLREQLRRLVPPAPPSPQPGLPRQAARPEPPAASPPPLLPVASAERIELRGPPGARYFVRTLRFAPEARHGLRQLGELAALDVAWLAELADAEPVPGAPGSPVFLDVETTALGGGAGVYVFLVGLGRLEPSGWLLEQWLLREPAAEPALLAELAARLQGAALVVSFGGRSFDARMLADRFRLHRLPSPLQRRHHADLATPARALWRSRLGSCTLQAIERQRLGIARTADLPSALCPQLYFDWLRRPGEELAPMAPVLAHNAADVLALPVLALELAARTRRGTDPAERLGLGQHWRRRRRWEASRRELERSLALDRSPGHAPLAARERAILFAELGRVYRRLGRYAEAARAWAELLRLPEPPLEALLALARLAEHRTRELVLAEHAAALALSLLRRRAARLPAERAARLQAELVRRLERLARKRAAAAAAAGLRSRPAGPSAG